MEVVKTYFDDQVILYKTKPFEDNRGALCNLKQLKQHEFIEPCIVTNAAGVLRGLHYETDGRARYVTVISGHIMDVVVNVQTKEFITIPNWHGIDYLQLWIPSGFAHGYYCYEPSTVLYLFTKPYNETKHRVIRWDSLGIPWPAGHKLISDKDLNG